MIENPLEMLPPEFEPRGPASAEHIEEAERELRVTLPEDYRTFLTTANGGEGPMGGQSYVILWPVEELVEHNRGYKPDPDYAPGLTLIGTDGGNEVFAVRSGDGHYVAAPLIGMSDGAIKDLGATFAEFVQTLP